MISEFSEIIILMFQKILTCSQVRIKIQMTNSSSSFYNQILFTKLISRWFLRFCVSVCSINGFMGIWIVTFAFNGSAKYELLHIVHSSYMQRNLIMWKKYLSMLQINLFLAVCCRIIFYFLPLLQEVFVWHLLLFCYRFLEQNILLKYE